MLRVALLVVLLVGANADGQEGKAGSTFGTGSFFNDPLLDGYAEAMQEEADRRAAKDAEHATPGPSSTPPGGRFSAKDAEPAAKAANVILSQLYKVAEKNGPSLVMGAFGWAIMSSAKRLGPKGVTLFSVLLGILGLFALVWLHGQVCVGQALNAELEYVAAFCAAAVLVSQQQGHMQSRSASLLSPPSFLERTSMVLKYLVEASTVLNALKMLLVMIVLAYHTWQQKIQMRATPWRGWILECCTLFIFFLVVEALEWFGFHVAASLTLIGLVIVYWRLWATSRHPTAPTAIEGKQ
jgi:hypothetical protein